MSHPACPTRWLGSSEAFETARGSMLAVGGACTGVPEGQEGLHGPAFSCREVVRTNSVVTARVSGFQSTPITL